eukprot:m51a1_g6477 putative alpha amylase (1467) ;mRNA; r:97656-103300
MSTNTVSAAVLTACLIGSAVAASALPDISVVGVQAVKDWANARVRAAEQGRSHYASPSFWGSEIVYQIQIDRFNNGNLTNDNLNLPAVQASNQNSNNMWGLPDYRMGGDLSGITARLDYLKDLGITSLWITPFLKHNGDYHGYCVADYTEVDPGFGTAEELRELVSQAHSRGIRIVMDVVFNHICDRNTHYSRQPDSHYDCTNTLDAACGPNTGAEMSGDESRIMFGDFTDLMFDLDTRNYDFQEIFTALHKYWIAYADIDGFRLDAAKFTTADFIAYFSTEVRRYANSIGKNNFLVLGEVAAPPDWIGRSVGKMMSNPLNPNDHGNGVPAALTARLNDLKSTYLAHPYSKYPGLDAVYNFALSGTLKDLLMNQRSAHSLEDAFNAQYQQTLAAQNDARLDWNHVEIHDWPRVVEGGSDPYKSRLAVSALTLVQGTPVLYYGIEQGFNGNCHWNNMNLGAATQSVQSVCSANGDVVHRQNMFMGSGWRLGSTVASIDKLAYVGKSQHTPSPAWQQDPFLDRSHMVYKAARKINAIRQSCNALKTGWTAFRWGDFGNTGIVAFSRIAGSMEIVVVINTASWTMQIPRLQIDSGINGVSGQRYKNLLNGYEVAWTGKENGNSFLYFNNMNIEGNSVKIFAHENNIGDWNAYLEASLCKGAPVPLLVACHPLERRPRLVSSSSSSSSPATHSSAHVSSSSSAAAPAESSSSSSPATHSSAAHVSSSSSAAAPAASSSEGSDAPIPVVPLPDISVVGPQAVKDWANARVRAAEANFQKRRSHYASPSFWGSEIVYQIQIDRFNNGNLSNDNLNLPATQAANQNTPNQYGLPDYRMGGDLRGIVDRLDYLKDLGITSLWITPFLKHNGDYHGYCVTDYTEVDPGFGTANELRELVSQAHSRGIRIVMDVVFNHICDRNTHYSRQPDSHYDCTNTLDAAYWAGQPTGSPKQGDISCGPNTGAEMGGDESRVMFGDFTDLMFDLDTRNYDFQEIFTALHKYWIAYADIDGFRLDAAKFTTADFIAYFSTQVRAYANSIGKNNFLVLGEVAAPPDWIGRSVGKMMSNPSNPNDHGNGVPAALTARLNDLKSTYLAHPYSKYPGLDAVYNFALSGTLKDLLMNQRITHALEDAFSAQYQQTLASQGDARLDWNNVEIHDWPRMVEGGSDPTKSRLGVSALPFVQGTPVLYYGIEQGFNGNCHWNNMNLGAATQQVQSTCSANGDVVHRQNMFMGSGWRLGSTISSIDNLAYVGKAQHTPSPAWQQDPYLDRSHMVYKAARKANAIRQSCSALNVGQTTFRWGDFSSSSGVLAFSRIAGSVEIVVVINTASSSQPIPRLQIDRGINGAAGQRYKNMMAAGEVATTSIDNGNSYLNFGSLSIEGNSVKVFTHENNLGSWNAYLEAYLCKGAPVPVPPASSSSSEHAASSAHHGHSSAAAASSSSAAAASSSHHHDHSSHVQPVSSSSSVVSEESCDE